MFIVSKTQDEYGNYQKIKKWPELTPPDDYYWWPDYLEQDTFNQYKGFVNLVIQRDTVASYTPDQEAYNEWKETHPDPEPDPGTDMSAYATWDELAKAYKEGVNLVE